MEDGAGVEMVQSVNELPDWIRDQIKEANVMNAREITDQGSVYFEADNIPNKRIVPRLSQKRYCAFRVEKIRSQMAAG